MRSPAVAFAAVVLVSVVAVSRSGVVSDADVRQVAPYSIIDPIIKTILNKMRPKLANLTFPDVEQSIVNSNLNGSIVVRDMTIKNADSFEITSLKSSLLPLKLTNLTLTWTNITAVGSYDVDLHVDLPQLIAPLRIFAKGNASFVLKNIFFTVGANVEMKNKGIQIKPKGLFGFDLRLQSADVTLTSLMGSPEFGQSLGAFLGRAIPDVVAVFKKPLFDLLQDDIINIVNEVLRKNGTVLEDEFSPFGAVAELDPFFGRPLDLSAEFEDKEYNFNF